MSGKTTLDFDSTPSPQPLECKIVTAAKATSDNFVLASSKTDYKLFKLGYDWKAVGTKNTVPLSISTSGDITYGKTMNVKVTVQGDATTKGEVTLKVNLSGGRSELIFDETKNIGEDKSVTFDVPLTKSGDTHYIKASFKEGMVNGFSDKVIHVAHLPLTISGVKVPSREYSTNAEVKIPYSSFEHATLSGYINEDIGAELLNRDYLAKLDSSDLNVGDNKKIVFLPDAEFLLIFGNQTQKNMYYKYYVPVPQDLTVDIKKQVLKGYTIPVPIGSIGLGQSLKDVILQTPSALYDYKWKEPDTKPEIGKQTGYPIICTIKDEHTLNYEFDSQIPGFDADLKGIVMNVRVGVDAESIRKEYFTNDGEKQEKIDLSELQPYGENIAAKDVTLTLNSTNSTQNISDVVFDQTTKQLSYKLANTSTAINDMAVFSFKVMAANQVETTFKVIISTVDRIDLSSIDTAIIGAENAKYGITSDERAASSVKKGIKFVNAVEMEALDNAIKIAEAAKTTVNTTAQAKAAADLLDSAIARFKAAIKTGSYKNDDDPSSENSPSGGSGVVTPLPEDKPNDPTQSEIKLTPKIDDKGNASVTVSEKDVRNAIEMAHDEAKKNGKEKNGISLTITLNITPPPNSFTVHIPKAMLEAMIAEGIKFLTINAGVTLTFDLEAIKEIKNTANADVTVTVTNITNTELSKEAQAAIGGRPVYDFKVTGGGKNFTTFGSGKIALSIPYELQKVDENGSPSETGSLENPEKLAGVYVDENGKLNYLSDSKYNANNKTMLINIAHFSVYAVAYKTNIPAVTDTAEQTSKVTFSDIANHWAKEDIEFVAARGVLAGTGNNQFSPNNSMTRGMFVMALGRLSGVNIGDYKTQIFTDVKTDAYYVAYVNWAKSKHIVTDTRATTFSPEQSITRQEMALMLQNYSKAIDYKLPIIHKEIAFTDSDNIGTWAKSAVKEMQMAGILMGRDGGDFDPSGTATRAEVSAMLRRFVELVASGNNANIFELTLLNGR